MDTKIGKTRLQLMEASKSLFVKFGFDRISMDDIAQAAHKAKRSIYNHFSNKEDLFASMMENEFEKLKERLTEAFEISSAMPLDQLQYYLVQRYELIKESGIWKLVAEHSQAASVSYNLIRHRMDSFEAWEHGQFERIWKSMPSVLEEPLVGQNASAFADMLQMVLKSLDYAMFVQDKYEQYKDTYNFLIIMIINSIKAGGLDIILKSQIQK